MTWVSKSTNPGTDSTVDRQAVSEVRALLAAATATKGDDASKEHVLDNGVTVYAKNKNVVGLYKDLVDSFAPDLWQDNGATIDIPEDLWMEIPLLPNWRELYKGGQAKVYPLGAKDRAVVDETFDKLHDQGRMEWTHESTPFSYPCFMVWLDKPDGTRKGRVVVDIRALNKITEPDAYPLPQQSEIINEMRGSGFISVVDCASFIYQWPVRQDHRHRLTVVSHQGQETFRVASRSWGIGTRPPMPSTGLTTILWPASILRPGLLYVDDNCHSLSKTLEEHLNHLNTVVFGTLRKIPRHRARRNKSFLAFPQYPPSRFRKVDALGLLTGHGASEGTGPGLPRHCPVWEGRSIRALLR